MNNILLNYLLKKFFKNFFLVVIVFYCFGIILNLFEEVEFFKNLNVSILTPLALTSIYIPSLIIKILPFIIFISCMWFMVSIRNNKDLLILKVFGYSNIKIFFILAFSAFIMGWLILFFINPVTSTMSKYYEKTKSNYSRDVDHLINFNKDGLWIKEKINNKHRFISSSKLIGYDLQEVTIFHLGDDSKFINKIIAKNANIEKNEWVLTNGIIFTSSEGVVEKKEFDIYKINSIYDLQKINSLFKNFDTMSFVDLILNYKKLLNNGYNESFLNQSLHSMLVLPFFLLLMTAIASILTIGNLKQSNNLTMIVVGLITVVLIFYLKDLSLALGQIGRIPLILSVWAPIIALSLFTFIGVLQINEK